MKKNSQVQIECPQCGKKFKRKYPSQIVCSYECHKGYRQRPEVEISFRRIAGRLMRASQMRQSALRESFTSVSRARAPIMQQTEKQKAEGVRRGRLGATSSS